MGVEWEANLMTELRDDQPEPTSSEQDSRSPWGGVAFVMLLVVVGIFIRWCWDGTTDIKNKQPVWGGEVVK